jgi:hypothetical protein
MNDADLQAEHELVAEVCRMADSVVAGMQLGAAPTDWQQRREQIAALRQRIRAMRDRHLGSSSTTPPRVAR